MQPELKFGAAPQFAKISNPPKEFAANRPFHKPQRVSYVEIKPHPWRRLKTESSARIVPLVGASLWAAQRIVEENDNGFAFPRYNQDEVTNANSASAALNKWLKETVSDSCTMHSFRHSMRDRLRNVECPTELVDQIGGWSKSGNIGQSYGSGYSLEMMHKWLAKMAIE